MLMFCKTILDLTFFLQMNSYCCFSHLLRNVHICCSDFLICDILSQRYFSVLFSGREGKFVLRLSVKHSQAGMSQLMSPATSDIFLKTKTFSGRVCKLYTRECGQQQAQLLAKETPEPFISKVKMAQKVHPAALSVGFQELQKWQVNDWYGCVHLLSP